MVYDSIRAEDTDAPSHVSIREDIEKLVEAAWVIFKQNGNGTVQKKQDLELDQNKRELQEMENGKLIGCYKAINEFFESFTLPFFLYYLLTAIKAAEGTTIWNKRAPSDLLYFFENFRFLFQNHRHYFEIRSRCFYDLISESPLLYRTGWRCLRGFSGIPDSS